MALFKEANRKWWILFAMTSCISMIFVDVTVLPVALPTIERQFNSSVAALQWIINGYTLALSVFVLAGGKMGDIWGHRRTFCLGLFLFAISSAFCGISPNMSAFIASRVLQGIGGAILIPTTSAILFTNFPSHQRGKAMGLYVSIGSIFLAFGPFLGGSLTEYFSWRMIFFINLPIATLGFTLAMLSVPKTEGKKHSFDTVGFITLALGLSAIIISLMEGNSWGWTSFKTIGLLLLGIGSITALILTEREVKHPLIEFHLYKNKVFLGANTSIFFTQLQIGATVFWAIYLQNVLGYSPSEAGVLGFLSNTPIFVMAPLSGMLVDKYGPKIPVISGFILLFVALILFVCNPSPNLSYLFLILLPYGCGIPLIFTPSFTSAMAQVDDAKRGMVSAMTSCVRQCSTTLGIALFTALFVSRNTTLFSSLLESNMATKGIDPTAFTGLVSQTPDSLAALHAEPLSSTAFILEYSKEAYISAFTLVNIAAAIFTLIGLALAIFLFAKAKAAVNSKN